MTAIQLSAAEWLTIILKQLGPNGKTCPKGHLITLESNIVIEHRKGRPKVRCRICRKESWRKNSARRAKLGLHT
jgi:hypothetical protein